jgi:hypothetical protein
MNWTIGDRFQTGTGIFIFATTSRPVLEPTQQLKELTTLWTTGVGFPSRDFFFFYPPQAVKPIRPFCHWIPHFFNPGVKRADDHSHPFSSEVRTHEATFSLPLYALMG